MECVVELNKGDKNVGGDMGREMRKKGESVVVMRKKKDCGKVREVDGLEMGEKEFKGFGLSVNEGGVGVVGEGDLFENGGDEKGKEGRGFMEVRMEEEGEGVWGGFGEKGMGGFENMVEGMMSG